MFHKCTRCGGCERDVYKDLEDIIISNIYSGDPYCGIGGVEEAIKEIMEYFDVEEN